ncbi:MAG TPA: hypothetical protein VEI97_08365 [bacterium]|nr:hypothetical protein [bacterium]
MTPLYPGPPMMAGGTIGPCKIVKQDTTGDFEVLQAGANDPAFGVSQEGQKATPGLVGSDADVAAEDGDPIQVICIGTALVKLGGTVTRGDYVEADANGDAVTASGAGEHYVVGKALESGTDDQFRKVWVFPQKITIA